MNPRLFRRSPDTGIMIFLTFPASEYGSSYCCTKTLYFMHYISALSDVTRELLHGAIKSGLSVNHTRAILIKSDCTDFRDFRDFREYIVQDFTLCLTQIDTLRASYDVGGYRGGESSAEEMVMHIFVPIK